ncbi:hypothetical protein Tco_0273253 [Tanacetum coccineum]
MFDLIRVSLSEPARGIRLILNMLLTYYMLTNVYCTSITKFRYALKCKLTLDAYLYAPLVYTPCQTPSGIIGGLQVWHLRSFFEKQKLTHPIPVAPVALPRQQVPPEALAAHAAWVKGQKEVFVPMLLTMDLEIQQNLAHLGAYDML